MDPVDITVWNHNAFRACIQPNKEKQYLYHDILFLEMGKLNLWN